MRKYYFFLFILGLGIGIFFGLKKVNASTPIGEISGGQPYSLVYDEVWNATEAVVSSTGGYMSFTDFPTDATPAATPAGKIEKTANGWVTTVFPKMLVTKWKVHGHIHFR